MINQLRNNAHCTQNDRAKENHNGTSFDIRGMCYIENVNSLYYIINLYVENTVNMVNN